ncbi:MAG: hypothetical protein RL619_1879, partial [Bacteroidota bacterium]
MKYEMKFEIENKIIFVKFRILKLFYIFDFYKIYIVCELKLQ